MPLAVKISADKRYKQLVEAANRVQDYIRSSICTSHYKLLFIIYEDWIDIFARDMYGQVKHCNPTATLQPLIKLAFCDLGLVGTLTI